MQTVRTGIKRNMLYGLSSWVVPLGLGIVTTPIIVHSLGAHEYGIYSLVFGFVAYSFYFNIGRAITKYVSEYRASGEVEKIRDVITATFCINIAVGLVGLAATILLAPWLVSDIFRVEGSLRTEALTSLYVAAFLIFFLMLGQVFHAVIQGVNRFDIFSKIQNATSLLLIAGNVAIVLAGYGLVQLLYWNLVTTLLNVTLAAISAVRLLPEFGISPKLKRETLSQVIRYSSAVVGYQIAANVILLFERGWITANLGADNLTFYVVPMTLGVLLHAFIYSLMMTLFPVASELSGDRVRLLELYKKATKVVCFLVAFAVTTFIALDRTALTVWMGADFSSQSATLLIFHIMTFGLVSVGIIAFQLSEGLGFPAFGFWTTLSIMIVSIPLMVYLIGPYGNLGVAVARFAGFSLLFPAIIYLERWAFGKVQIRFWGRLLGQLLISALIAAAIAKVLEQLLPTNLLSFLIMVGVAGIGYCTVLFALGFIGEDERKILDQIKQKAWS